MIQWINNVFFTNDKMVSFYNINSISKFAVIDYEVGFYGETNYKVSCFDFNGVEISLSTHPTRQEATNELVEFLKSNGDYKKNKEKVLVG